METTTSFPPRDWFYSSLLDETITTEDYERGEAIWRRFNCRNLKDFLLIYLRQDVTLLADLIQKFRQTCLEHFQLDCCFYLTLPSLSFDAMLKQTGVEIQLISNLNMILFLERGIVGGICQVHTFTFSYIYLIVHIGVTCNLFLLKASKRYAEANNPYLRHYNPQLPISYIMYLDFNR